MIGSQRKRRRWQGCKRRGFAKPKTKVGRQFVSVALPATRPLACVPVLLAASRPACPNASAAILTHTWFGGAGRAKFALTDDGDAQLTHHGKSLSDMDDLTEVLPASAWLASDIRFSNAGSLVEAVFSLRVTPSQHQLCMLSAICTMTAACSTTPS
jgi:hypothetical protein